MKSQSKGVQNLVCDKYLCLLQAEWFFTETSTVFRASHGNRLWKLPPNRRLNDYGDKFFLRPQSSGVQLFTSAVDHKQRLLLHLSWFSESSTSIDYCFWFYISFQILLEVSNIPIFSRH